MDLIEQTIKIICINNRIISERLHEEDNNKSNNSNNNNKDGAAVGMPVKSYVQNLQGPERPDQNVQSTAHAMRFDCREKNTHAMHVYINMEGNRRNGHEHNTTLAIFMF